MNKKVSILIIALIILVTLVAVSQALNIYEKGNITLEEHNHDHGEHNHEEHEHEEHANESNKTENHTHEEHEHENEHNHTH